MNTRRSGKIKATPRSPEALWEQHKERGGEREESQVRRRGERADGDWRLTRLFLTHGCVPSICSSACTRQVFRMFYWIGENGIRTVGSWLALTEGEEMEVCVATQLSSADRCFPRARHCCVDFVDVISFL